MFSISVNFPLLYLYNFILFPFVDLTDVYMFPFNSTTFACPQYFPLKYVPNSVIVLLFISISLAVSLFSPTQVIYNLSI